MTVFFKIPIPLLFRVLEKSPTRQKLRCSFILGSFVDRFLDWVEQMSDKNNDASTSLFNTFSLPTHQYFVDCSGTICVLVWTRRGTLSAHVVIMNSSEEGMLVSGGLWVLQFSAAKIDMRHGGDVTTGTGGILRVSWHGGWNHTLTQMTGLDAFHLIRE